MVSTLFARFFLFLSVFLSFVSGCKAFVSCQWFQPFSRFFSPRFNKVMDVRTVSSIRIRHPKKMTLKSIIILCIIDHRHRPLSC